MKALQDQVGTEAGCLLPLLHFADKELRFTEVKERVQGHMAINHHLSALSSVTRNQRFHSIWGFGSLGASLSQRGQTTAEAITHRLHAQGLDSMQ